MASELNQVLARYSNCVPIGGNSGQKKVFYVNDRVHGEFVLKVVISPFPGAMKRIEREVQVLQSINSPYYPEVFEIQQVSSTCTVIREEYIPSQPLSQLLGNYTAPLDVLRLILEVTTGLKILWDRDIVHRDVKPDNILITPGGKPKIIDLGIARVLNLETLTHPMGRGPLTPAYAAPEQLRNSKVDIDPRTDQFLIGIVLVQLLLGGRHPFDPRIVGAGQDIMDNILNDRWFRHDLTTPALSPVSPLASKLLSHQPHGRFRLPEQLIAAVEATIQSYII